MKLLIADDSILLQNRLIELLSDIENLEIVGTAINSLEASDKIDLLGPDIVITDIRMPGGGGVELAKNISVNHPNIILIVHTNYPYPQYRKKFEEIGINYFFQKMTDTEELYQTISKLCAENLYDHRMELTHS